VHSEALLDLMSHIGLVLLLPLFHAGHWLCFLEWYTELLLAYGLLQGVCWSLQQLQSAYASGQVRICVNNTIRKVRNRTTFKELPPLSWPMILCFIYISVRA
jgi:hypothetical protein